jgi:protein-tyrosine phosphatase
MAQALFAAALPGRAVGSAGLNAMVGSPPPPHAVDLMKERGLDISTHRAVQINRSMCLEHDLILVMEREQKQRLQKLYPEVHGRVFALSEHANLDVPDPYRQPASVFRGALAVIDDSIQFWLNRLQRL